MYHIGKSTYFNINLLKRCTSNCRQCVFAQKTILIKDSWSDIAYSVRYKVTAMISATGGRFPRAWLQPPRRFSPAGSSAHAIPAGVAALRFNQQNVLTNSIFD
jgi:hypothetical protein